MFWGSSSLDMKINLIATLIFFIVAILIYLFKKRILLSLFLFSLFSNFIWYYGLDFNLAEFYNLQSMLIFIRNYWPIINLILFIILIFQFLKNASSNKK